MENIYRKGRGENPEIYKDWKTILAQEEGKLVVEDDDPSEILIELEQMNNPEIEALKPAWIEGEEEAEEIWQDFVTEFLEAAWIAEDGDPAVLAAYYDQYYKMVLGDLAERYLPKTLLNAHHGFGDGYWQAEYYAGGNPAKLRAAQYLSPRNILEGGQNNPAWQAKYADAIRSTHFNLCGQLAVIEGMGIGLEEGLRIFYEDVEDRKQEGNYILGNPAVGTRASDLISFILAIAKRRNENWEVAHFYMENWQYRSSYLDAQLSKDDILIALVNIDPSPSGEGIIGDRGDCAHWVVLQDIFDLAGKQFLRLYNPFMNREEVYLWERFEEGWEGAEYDAMPRYIRGKKLA